MWNTTLIQPSLVSDFETYLKDHTPLKVRVVLTESGYVNVTIFAGPDWTLAKEQELKELAFKYFNDNLWGKVVGFKDVEEYNYINRTKDKHLGVPVEGRAIHFFKRQAQTSIKVTGKNWKDVLVEFSDGSSEIVFGERYLRGSGYPRGTALFCAERLPNCFRYYELPSSGLFVMMSQKFAIGYSSQELLAQFKYIEFPL